MIKIGVDPDTKKSGVAIRKEDGPIEYGPYTISQLLTLCQSLASHHGIDRIEIRLEAGWINAKGNFRRVVSGKAYGESVALDVGRNQGFGLAIAQLLTGNGFKVSEVKPTQKFKMKVKGAWTPEGRKLFAKISGITARINDDTRDAVLLVL